MPSPVLPPTASSMVPPLMVILVLPAAIEPLPMPAPLSPPWAFTVPPLMVILVLPVAIEPLPMPAPLSPPLPPLPPPLAVMLPPVISMVPVPLPLLEPMPAAPLPPVAVRMPESFSDVMVSLPVSTESSLSSLLFSLCSRPACWPSLVRVLSPLSVIVVLPAPSTLRAASLLALMLTSSSVTLRVLSLTLLMILMT